MNTTLNDFFEGLGKGSHELCEQFVELKGTGFYPGCMLLTGWPVYARDEMGIIRKYVVSSVNISDKCVQYTALCYDAVDTDLGEELLDDIDFTPEEVGNYVFLTEKECEQSMFVEFKDKEARDKGYCELTKEMDSYMNGGPNIVFKTYLMAYGTRKEVYNDESGGHVYAIRFPGATCGDVLTDKNGVIETINFYSDTCYVTFRTYRPEMEKLKEKYVGRKIFVR